ncbi:MAG: alpha/beta fold hydrolase [Steroidobacteraceae bacterium]
MPYEPVRIPRDEQVTVRGLHHHLTWWGEPAEAPIVLLHGYQDCGATWQFLVDCLPRTWSLVAPDWRGFGRSEWAPGGYWFPDYLADLEALLDRLVPYEAARIIGHSMGANVAQLYAGVRPKRLAWLASLEGLGLHRSDPGDAPARYAQWLDELRQAPREGRFASAQALAALLTARNPRLPSERAEFLARAWTRPVGPVQPVQPAGSAGSAGSDKPADIPGAEPDGEVELRFDPRHRQVNPVLYRREEAEACWARIEAPVLLLLGEQSDHRAKHLPPASEAALQTLFRALQIVTLPGVGHLMHHENPAAVAHHVMAFDQTCATAPNRRLRREPSSRDAGES